MAYKQLWILVEGVDDDRFFEIIRPTLIQYFDYVKTYKYAQVPSEKIQKFVISLRAMASVDFYFLIDINRSPCITDRKDITKNAKNYGRILDESRIIVVTKEIESWYLAGLDERCSNLLGLEDLSNTDNVTKEMFNQMIPSRFDSRIDFMQEIRKYFSIETALTKNSSFRYFIARIRGG